MGQTGGTTRTISETRLPEYQLPSFTRLLEEANRLYSSGGPRFFPGSTVADFAPAERTAFEHVERIAPMMAGIVQDWALPALGTALLGPGIVNSPYVHSMAESATRPIMQNLLENVLPDLRQGAVAAGQRGGTREALAASQAVERTSRAAMDTASDIYGRAYLQGLQTMLGGIQALPTVMSQMYEPAEWLSGVGEAQRAMEQARINESIARWMHEQNLPWQTLSEYANLISVPMGGVSTSTVEATPSGQAMQIIGAILGGLATIPGFIDWILRRIRG